MLNGLQTTPSGGQPCTASFSIDNTWQSDGVSYAVFSLYLRNTGTSAVDVPYTVTLANGGYTGVQNSWNWQVKILNLYCRLSIPVARN